MGRLGLVGCFSIHYYDRQNSVIQTLTTQYGHLFCWRVHTQDLVSRSITHNGRNSVVSLRSPMVPDFSQLSPESVIYKSFINNLLVRLLTYFHPYRSCLKSRKDRSPSGPREVDGRVTTKVSTQGSVGTGTTSPHRPLEGIGEWDPLIFPKEESQVRRREE